MRRLLWLALAANLLVLLWSLGELPDRVAMHFDGAMAADDFASRSTYALLIGALIIGLTAVLVGLSEWTRRSMPMSLVNLPHKQRWIDAGQEGQLRRLMAGDLDLISFATLLLLMGTQVLTVRANRQDPPVLDGATWVLLAIYLAAVLGWTAYITVVKYRTPPPASD